MRFKTKTIFPALSYLSCGVLLFALCTQKPLDDEALEKMINAAIMESPTISNQQFENGDLPVDANEAIAMALADARKATEDALPQEAAFDLEIRGIQLVAHYYAMREVGMEGKVFWVVEISVLSNDGAGKLGYCRSIVLMSGFKYSRFYTPAEQKEMAEMYEIDTSLPFIAGRYDNGYWPLRSKKRYAKATTVTGEYGGRAVASGKLPMSFATAASRARVHCQAAVERYAEVYGGDKDGISIKDVATVGYMPEKESWFVEFYFETAEGVRDTMGFDFFLPIEILPNGECFPFIEDFVRYTGDPNMPRPEIEE